MSHHVYVTLGHRFLDSFFFFNLNVGEPSTCLSLSLIFRQNIYLHGSTKFEYSYQIWQVGLKKKNLFYRDKILFQ